MLSLSNAQVNLLLCRPKQKRQGSDGMTIRRWPCGCGALQRGREHMELAPCDYHGELFGALEPHNRRAS